MIARRQGERYYTFAIVIVLVVAGTALASRGHAADVDPVVKTLMRYQHVYLKGLQSLDVQAQFVLTPASATNRPTLKQAVRVVTDHGKSYCRFTYTDMDTQEPSSVTSACDGEHYQRLAGETPLLSVSQKPLLTISYGGALHPITLMYRFAITPGQGTSLTYLQSREAWDRMAEHVEACEELAVEGREGMKVKFRVPSMCAGCEGEDVFEVFFASDLGYLPVHWTGDISGGAKCEYNLLQTTAVESPTGPMVLPLKLEAADYLPNGELLQRMAGQVDRESLRVNARMDERLFRIPKSLAAIYLDTDSGSATNPVGRSTQFTRELLQALYAESMTRVQDHLTQEMRERWTDEVTSRVSDAVEGAYGPVEGVKLEANEQTEDFRVETTWLVIARNAKFGLKLAFDEEDRVSDLWLRASDEAAWSPGHEWQPDAKE